MKKRAKSVTADEPVVLGQELAWAIQAEKQRLQTAPLKTERMPAAGYSSARKQYSLYRLTPLKLDARLRELTDWYSTTDEQSRLEFCGSINMNQLYTLLHFSKRAAIFAMRDGDSVWLKAALESLGMIDIERVDYRDVLISIAIVLHAARRMDVEVESLIVATRNRAAAPVSQMFKGFLKQSSKYHSLKASWGLTEISTPAGIGLIGWGFHKYRPKVDLTRVILEIAERVEQDKYHPGDPEIASELYPFWFSREPDPQLESLLRTATGVAMLDAQLRSTEFANHASQQFTVFLAEMPTGAAVNQLLETVQRNRTRAYTKLAVGHDRLFCLIVARSFEVGVPAFETNKSLQRFLPMISEALATVK